jgi:ABC-2 type transport system ATP-binding protein
MASLELALDGLRRRYGTVTALDGLTFGVPAGQVFGFLGPNGAGKTTTMRAIFGVTALDAGEIRWRGRPVDEAARRTFGYMPEERGLKLAQSCRDDNSPNGGRGRIGRASGASGVQQPSGYLASKASIMRRPLS